jgi:hypothetical protein
MLSLEATLTRGTSHASNKNATLRDHLSGVGDANQPRPNWRRFFSRCPKAAFWKSPSPPHSSRICAGTSNSTRRSIPRSQRKATTAQLLAITSSQHCAVSSWAEPPLRIHRSASSPAKSRDLWLIAQSQPGLRKGLRQAPSSYSTPGGPELHASI